MAKSAAQDLVRDIVQSPEAAQWLAQLTAAFFDSAGRRQVISGIRDGVAALAAGRHVEDLEQLRNAVVGQLVAMASRNARVPAAQKEPEPLLSGEALEDRVIQAYPHPIATPYRALSEQASATARFGCLLDTFESIVHFLATVAVSAYLRGEPASAECNQFLVEHFLKKNWSTGDLFGLLRETLRLGAANLQELPYPELSTYFFSGKGKPTTSLQVLESFVSLRNRCWGHLTGRDEEFYADLEPANRARLDQELARMRWLESWQLIRPVMIDETGCVRQADLLMGERRLARRSFELPLRPADLDGEDGTVQAEKTLLLVAPDRSRYLPLFPLSLYHFQLRGEGVYFLQRLEWQSGQRLRKTAYVAYKSRMEVHEELAGNLAVRVLQQQLQRLTSGLPESSTAAPAPAAEAADPDCELPEVRHEQEYHWRTFAGRERTLAEVAAWIDDPQAGSYLLIAGPPGQGKSALMAELARRLSERGGCLLHMVKSHRSPLKFVPALISQAARIAHARFGPAAYQGDLDDLRSALVRGLEAVQKAAGRAVVVLDALDELQPGCDPADFLPSILPAGVKIILTCRPDIPLLQGLRARLRGLQEKPLPPLDETDLPQLLDRRLGEGTAAGLQGILDWHALFRRLHGNPLFLQRAVDQVEQAVARARQEGSPLRMDALALPATPQDLFDGIYNEIAEKRGTRFTSVQGQHKARLLHILSLARDPLDLEALSELMALDGTPLSLEECRDRVLEMSRYLLDAGGGRFQPWHQGLADHVQKQVLGRAGCRPVEELFSSWLHRPARQMNQYGLRHRARHLLAAERFDELEDLFTDLHYLEARVQAEMVFDLVGDLAEVLRVLPANRPRQRLLRLLEQALRTDIAFLARHPTALLQCLWNRCWWFDCPQAARFIEPPPEGWPAEGAPWERPGPRLARLVESWRQAREQAEPGYLWIRSLLPPSVPLGGAVRTVLQGHEDEVRAVAYSPDGQLLASCSDDRTVRLWDVRRGSECACLRGHEASVRAVAFAPDGGRIASASEDGSLRLWEVSTGQLLRCLRGHEGPVGAVAFSGDGKSLASGGDDHLIQIWDADDGMQHRSLRGHQGPISAVAFAPDGRWLASASWDRCVLLWDLVEGGQDCLAGHAGRVMSLAFTPDGRGLASGGLDGSVYFWDTPSRAVVWQQEKVGRVRCVAVSPDGRRVAAGAHKGNVLEWDAQGQPLAVFREHEGSVNGLAFSPDGRHIASAAWDRTVRIWDARGGEAAGQRRDRSRVVTAVALDRAGQRLALGAGDGSLALLDVSNGQESPMPVGHPTRVRSVAFSPDGRFLASGSGDCTVRLWDVLSRQQVACLEGHRGTVRAVAFSADGRLIVSVARDRTVRIWDVASGKPLGLLEDMGSPVLCVAVSGDGRCIAAGLQDGRIGLCPDWTAPQGRYLRGHTASVLALAFSADGRRLASRSLDRTMRLWDIASGKCFEELPGSGDVAALASGASGYPCWAVSVAGETIVLSTHTRQPIAWMPDTVQHLTTDGGGRLWAGTHADHVCLFTLEGQAP